MKKFLSCTKTAIIFLILTLIVIGAYTYMLARPVSYGMNYHHESAYEGIAFEADIKFYPDSTMHTRSTTFEDGLESYYHYKGGYVFFLLAKTEAEYETEATYINENFEEAVASPFYATKTNAFKQVAEGPDGYVTTYTCPGATVVAIVGGVVILAMASLTALSFVLSKKTKSEE